MKRGKKNRVGDGVTRQSHSHDSERNRDNKNNNNQFLYTPTMKNGQHQSASRSDSSASFYSGEESALLKKLEKITSEINSMQNNSADNNQNVNNNEGDNSNNDAPSLQVPPHFGAPPGYPSSFSYTSPRPMEYVSGNDSPQKYNSENRLNHWGHDYGNNHARNNYSPQNYRQHPPQSGGYEMQSSMDSKDMSLNMKSLHASLAEAHEEHRRAMHRIEMENKERRALEQQNFSLNNKLTEARQSVKDLQSALQSAHFATEQLHSKRSQREDYIAELQEVNNSNISRIATLEAKLKEAEEGLLEGNDRRDAFIHQLQSQLAASQEEVYSSQNEINNVIGQKCQMEADLDTARQRLEICEKKLKDSENAIELTYKAKISVLEDKNQSLMDKIAGEKHVYNQIQHLEEQLAQKSAALQRSQENSRKHELALHESIGTIRNKEDEILRQTEEIKQMESKMLKLENELKKEKQTSSQCKVLESELSSKNTEMKLLNQSLNDTQSSLQDAEMKIESLSQDINDKNSEIVEIDQKLKQALKMNMTEKGFNEVISSMQTELNEMEASLMHERATRKAAETDTETLQIKIRSLEVNIKEKQSVIAERDAEIKKMQKIVNSEQKKTALLEEMEDKNMELTHALNVEIQACRMSKREVEKQDMKIQALENQLQVKEKSIQDLDEAMKAHSISEVSDRIMASTIQQLESQLEERDNALLARNEKIKNMDKTLQDSLNRIRELESLLKEKTSECQDISYQKQNAERDAAKQKSTLSSLKNKLDILEKQNEAMEARTKKLLLEKHEAANKIEMTEKMVQDMAEQTIDSDAAVREQQRLTEELRRSGEQVSELASALDKSNATIAVLRDSLAKSDEEIKKLTSESHATHVAKSAVDHMITNLRRKQNKSAENGDTATKHQGDGNSSSSKKQSEGEPSSLKRQTEGGSSSPRLKDISRQNSRVQSQQKLQRRSESMLSEDNNRSLTPNTSSDPPPKGNFQSMMSFASEMSEVDGAALTQQNLENLNEAERKQKSSADLTDMISATRRDVDKINAKRKEIRTLIEKFTEDFKNTHERAPTAEEKANASGNIFANYQQLSHILKKKNSKLSNLEEQLKALHRENENTSADKE